MADAKEEQLDSFVKKMADSGVPAGDAGKIHAKLGQFMEKENAGSFAEIRDIDVWQCASSVVGNGTRLLASIVDSFKAIKKGARQEIERSAQPKETAQIDVARWKAEFKSGMGILSADPEREATCLFDALRREGLLPGDLLMMNEAKVGEFALKIIQSYDTRYYIDSETFLSTIKSSIMRANAAEKARMERERDGGGRKSKEDVAATAAAQKKLCAQISALYEQKLAREQRSQERSRTRNTYSDRRRY